MGLQGRFPNPLRERPREAEVAFRVGHHTVRSALAAEETLLTHSSSSLLVLFHFPPSRPSCSGYTVRLRSGCCRVSLTPDPADRTPLRQPRFTLVLRAHTALLL